MVRSVSSMIAKGKHSPVIVDRPESMTVVIKREDLRRRIPRLLLPTNVTAFFFRIDIFDCDGCGECFVRLERMNYTSIAHVNRKSLAHLDLVVCSMWNAYMGWDDG